MIKARHFIFIFVCVTASANFSFGSTPDVATNNTSPSESVGSLPYSTQWISEQTTSFLYLGFNRGQLNSQTLAVDSYTADFGSPGYRFPSLDFFIHLVSFAGAESSHSFLRDFSIWGRYSLGFAVRRATLSSSQTPIDGATDSLLVLSSRIGPVLAYDHWSWFKPYVGIELAPYAYRNTSDISGAEQQGGALSWGPVVGAHFPILFSGRASFLVEYHRTIPIQADGQILDNADNFTAGAGLAF